MRLELLPKNGKWRAVIDEEGLSGAGEEPDAAIAAVKRACIQRLADDPDLAGEDNVLWHLAPRRDVAERDRRILGKKVAWKKLEPGRPYDGLDAAAFGWLIDQRFVLPEQPLLAGVTAKKLRAFLEENRACRARGYVVGDGRSDCRVEVEEVVDARGKRVKVRGAKVGDPDIQTDAGDVLVVKAAIRERGGRFYVDGGDERGSATMEAARAEATRRAWRTLVDGSHRVDDAELARLGAVHVVVQVKTTSEWLLDHDARGDFSGAHRVAGDLDAFTRAFGPARFDPLDGEPQYGWTFRSKKNKIAWLGIRIRDAEDDVDERDARRFAKTTTSWELGASDEATAVRAARWIQDRAKPSTDANAARSTRAKRERR